MKPLSALELTQILSELAAEGCDPRSNSTAPTTSSPYDKLTSALGQSFSASNIQNIAILEDALSFISSDVLRGSGSIIGPDGEPVSDYWFGCLLAARREYGDAAKEAMRRWSQQSARYEEAGFERAWSQYDPSHKKPVTLGSLFMLAKAKGWKAVHRAASPPVLPKHETARFCLLDRSAIMAQPPMLWRIKGVLPETGIAALYGPSGSGKSFLAIDLGIAMAHGSSWFGHRTRPCPVTYVTLEGEAGLRNRIEAWEKHNGMAIPVDFKAMTQPFHLADPAQVEEFGPILPRNGVVIIDTLNRAAPGLDENSSQDMGRIIAGMKRLQEITEGLVLVVHHTGKDASKGLRGHSSLHASLDGAIEVERSANGRFWSASKVKDGEDGRQMAFKLHVVDLGRDADADPITSCAVSPDNAALFVPSQPSGKNAKAAFSSIKRLLSASSTFGQAGSNPQTPCLKVEDAVAGVAGSLTTLTKNRRTYDARRLVRSLMDGGYLKSAIAADDEAWLWQ